MTPLTAIRARTADSAASAWWAARTRLERLAARVVEPPRRFTGTHERVGLERLGLAHRDRVGYTPSGWLFLRRALRGERIGPGDVFVDFGSGKGRVLYHAARRPFGRVVGVEISEELNAIARSNLERNVRRLRCGEIEIVTCDAVSFSVPDDMTYAYLFNPFRGKTFRAVLANVVRSLERRPRDLTLIYVNPVEAPAVEATAHFALDRLLPGRREWDGIAVYRSVR